MIKLDTQLIQKLDFKHPATWIATWFGCGFMKPAPGTWGTLGALPFAILIYMLAGTIGILIGTILLILLGYWASEKFEEMVGEHDSSAIVIDEAAGLFMTFLILPTLNAYTIATAFFLFRFFDIIKPWPISWVDKKMPGAAGVMIDDLIAAFFAVITFAGIVICSHLLLN